MTFILVASAALFLASVLITVLIWLGLRITLGPRPGFWRRALIALGLLLPVIVFIGAPIALGIFGGSNIGTRHDERGYRGPRIARDGSWVRQSRATLRQEAKGEIEVEPALRASADAALIGLKTLDGVELRAFFVPPVGGAPKATVVLVHGLFRGGLELEAPAEMFRSLGAEVLLLEMRNHGGSARAPATFGATEKQDVIAAVQWLRRDPARARRPLVLFGVSLGTAAVVLAAAEIPDLAGLVLDAPVDDLLLTAHRMLSEEARAGRPGPSLGEPFRSWALTAIEWKNGFRFADVRPIDVVSGLSPELAVLVISGSEDLRLPPSTAEAMHRAFPVPADRKLLWVREGSDHGQVWIDDPEGYRSRLEQFFALLPR